MDMNEDIVSDPCRIMYVFTLLFSSITFLYLVIVSSQLIFLAKMLIQVIKDVKYFVILFGIFNFTFAECFHVVNVDISAYGRAPSLMAHSIATLRSAFGDFSLLDPK